MCDECVNLAKPVSGAEGIATEDVAQPATPPWMLGWLHQRSANITS